VLDPLFGWSGRSRSGLDVIDTPGGHYSMLQKPYVNAFADRLLEAIDPAQQRNAAFSG
jgi:thioesterase domain-containing protein